MTTENSFNKKSKKIIWRTVKFLLSSFIVLIGALYFISTSKFKNLIPELITYYAQEKYDVNLNFSSYETSRSENFPFLTFKIKGLYLQGPDCKNCDDKFLTINNLQFKIQPWDLMRSFVNIKDLHVEGAKVLLQEEEKIRKKSSPSENSTAKNIDNLQKIRLNTISLKDVLIEYQDDTKEKKVDVSLKNAKVFIQPKNEKVDIKLDANCFFEGLTFKQENGAFLKNKNADLSLNLEVFEDFILLENSSLQVDKDTLQLTGNYKYTDTPFLDLHIYSSNILLENVLPLLNDKLQKTLSTFKINKGLNSHFHIQGELKPNHPPAFDLDIETTNADFIFKNTQVTDMSLQANYSNHCRTKGERIQKGEDCLIIQSITGNLFDIHPINFSGVIHDLKKLKLEMTGTANLDLPSLQPYLKNTAYKFKRGKAELDIDYKGNFGTLLKGRLTQKSGIKIATKLKNTAFSYNNLALKNVSGKLLINPQKIDISKFKATYKNTAFSLKGQVDNIFDVVSNKVGKLQADLQLNIPKIDTEIFLTQGKKEKTEKINPTNLFSTIAKDISSSLEGKIEVEIKEFSHQKTLAKNSSFSLFIKDIEKTNSQEENFDFLQIKNLKTSLFNSLQVEADLFIQNIKEPKAFANFKVNSGLPDLSNFVKSKNISLLDGQIRIDATSDFLLKDLQSLSLSNVDKLNFKGKMNLSNGTIFLAENQQKIRALNIDSDVNTDSLYINSLKGSIANIPINLTGNISNYLAVLNEDKSIAQADLNLHFGTISLSAFDKNKAFAPQDFLQSLKSNLNKIHGQAIVKIDSLEIPNYPIKDLSFNLKIGKNEKKEFFLDIENFVAKLYSRTPFYANLNITNFTVPRLDLTAKSDLPLTELNTLIQDENFQTIKGLASIELAYKNTINDSFNLQRYLLTGDIKARVGFRDAEIFYEPRGLRFSELNGGISFTEENLTVDFPHMFFNDNVVNLSGDSHDFLPFFFEENKDFTVDLRLNSPQINFHKFDTPKTLKEKTKSTETKTETVDSPIARLLNEGNLSLNTKIDEVIYDNFHATNIVGRAKINDNEVVLDTFKMRTSDGLFGISSIISDIDKDKIHLTADVSMEKIDASKVLKSFNNFKQITLTNDNIIGLVDAEINLSTELNDNYEVKPDAMLGNLDLVINNGAFIDFNGLKNLDGFLFKKRKLHAVYFDTLHTNILLSGRDMKFAPTILNSTAATLTLEGLFTFSEEDKTDLIIEVPLGNIFTRYVERGVIRKNHKKRTGLPIIVEVTEKNKILDFNIQLRRDDEKR